MDVGPFKIDTSTTGIFRITFPSEYTEQEVRQGLNALTTIIGAHGDLPWTMLIDVSMRSSSSSLNRKIFSEWIALHADSLRINCRGWVLVVSNQVIRGAITAVLWFIKHDWPIEVRTTLADAEAKVRQMLSGDEHASCS